MWQHLGGRIGLFDAGTSDRNSLSVRYPGRSPGTPVLYGTQAREQAGKENFLPKHRTWSGGLLFTLPKAESSVGPVMAGNLPNAGGKSLADKTHSIQHSHRGSNQATDTA